MSGPVSMYALELESLRLLDITRDGYDPETGEVLTDDQLAEAFDALGDAVESKAVGAAHVIRRLLAEAEVLQSEERRLAERRRAVVGNVERLKDRLRHLLVSTGTPKVRATGVSISVGKPSQRVDVTDATALPEAYLVAQAPRVDKAALALAMKAGADVPGAALVNGPERLVIR